MRIKIMLVAVMMMASSVFGTFATIAQDMNEVNILYWQAPSILTPYLSTGTKDIHASSVVLEPLAAINPAGELTPVLAAEIPTVENGGVAEDLLSVTWTLKEGVMWSDGTPFTADDVIFTWEYCTHPEGGCTYNDRFDNVTSVEAVGDNQVLVTFDAPKPYPYSPFVTFEVPIIQKAQFEACVGAAMASCTDENFAPVGTGAFMVEEFRPNDVVTYVANPNYREEGKPFFDRVVLKGGGDAESAARAVLETGEADYAWNLQISPEVLGAMEAAGNGQVVVAYAQSIERVIINFSNPSPDCEVRSNLDSCGPHPFLTNMTIRQALSMAIDRNIIAEQLYGAGGRATCNLISGPDYNASPNNTCDQDIEGAIALLDEAGIVDSDGDGIREYEGTPLVVQYQTSTNAVRQSTQALIKQWWSEIGVETELRNIDASVFFGGDPGSPDTFQKFQADVQMYTSGASSPDQESFFSDYLCGEDPTPENGWTGNNVMRYCNEEYDAIFEEYQETAEFEARANMVIALNDILVQDYAQLPLVFRAGAQAAYSNTLDNVEINGWDSELWNLADWTRSE
jgi:peptide/nickel transport system substrate-binding protein